jgi:hypothetical protein
MQPLLSKSFTNKRSHGNECSATIEELLEAELSAGSVARGYQWDKFRVVSCKGICEENNCSVQLKNPHC